MLLGCSLLVQFAYKYSNYNAQSVVIWTSPAAREKGVEPCMGDLECKRGVCKEPLAVPPPFGIAPTYGNPPHNRPNPSTSSRANLPRSSASASLWYAATSSGTPSTSLRRVPSNATSIRRYAESFLERWYSVLAECYFYLRFLCMNTSGTSTPALTLLLAYLQRFSNDCRDAGGYGTTVKWLRIINRASC